MLLCASMISVQSVSENVLIRVMERDTFPVHETVHEITLFKVVIRWSIASCQTWSRGHSIEPEEGHSQDSVPSRVMTEKQMTEVILTGILSMDELQSIMEYIKDKDTEKLDFDFKPRKNRMQGSHVPSDVKYVTELWCMNIERPGKRMQHYFQCLSCGVNVCYVCISRCHSNCDIRNSYNDDGITCECGYYCTLTSIVTRLNSLNTLNEAETTNDDLLLNEQ